jgi:hypothetical protein
MQALQFPSFEYKIKAEKDQHFIFDEVRKKWLVLTPEEWVRQHLIHFLIQFKHFPRSLMQLEKQIKLNDTKKRFDLLVYNNRLQPLLLVECKAPNVALSQLVLDQILRYNLEIEAQIILITNGLLHLVYAYNSSTNAYTILQDIPDYKSIAAQH